MLCRSFTVSHGKMQSGMRITDGHRIQKGQLDNIHGNETKRALAWQRCQRNELRLLLQCPGLGMTQDHTSTRSQVFRNRHKLRQLSSVVLPMHAKPHAFSELHTRHWYAFPARVEGQDQSSNACNCLQVLLCLLAEPCCHGSRQGKDKETPEVPER